MPLLTVNRYANIPIGLYDISTTGDRVSVNRALLGILGLTSGDQVAQLARGEFPGGLPMAACLAQLAGADQVAGVVSRWRRPDGRQVSLRQSLAVARDPHGEAVSYSGTVEQLDDEPAVSDDRRADSARSGSSSLMERRYRQVADLTTDALLIDDREGKVVYANPAFLALFGLERADLHSLVLEDYVAPEWRTVLRERHERRVRGESVPAVFQYVGIRKDGTRIPLEAAVAAVIEDGELVGTQSTIRDITQRELLRDNLRVAHRTLDTLVTHLPLAIVGLDEDRRVKMWNPAAERILGWPRADILGNQCPGWDWASGSARDRQTLRDIISGQRICIDLETRWPHRDGSEVDVAVWTLLHYDGERLPTTTLVLADISKRQSTRADYRRLFENDHDAILLIDPDSMTILEANHQAELLYTDDGHSLIDTAVTSLYVNPDEIVAGCRSVLSSQAHRRQAYKHRAGNGDIIDVEVNLAVLNYAGRQVITSHNRDVTEHNRMVQQSIQSRKMEALGRLAGGVAHDFNNVLTALMGYPMLIKLSLSKDLSAGHPAGHPAFRHLDQIHALAHRAAGLSSQLLTFSRQQVRSLERLVPGAIVKDMRELLRRLIREDIELSIDTRGNQQPVMADAGQLEQLVMNLAVNARDAMPTGGVLRIVVIDMHVDAPIDDELPAGDYVLITVSDTGVGMDAQVREKLFEPFFTTKAVGTGTGLGLATVQGIVKQHVGAIRVESELGRGSQFRVYLPVSRPTAESAGHAESEHLDDSAPATSGALTILLVEDDDAVREFIRTVLVQSGHHIHEATDGQHAVSMLDRYGGDLDLIVSDLVMPKLGGGDLAAHVARNGPQVPILFMSGYTNEPDLRRLLEQPDVAYLQKPFTPQALLAKVAQVAVAEPGRAADDRDNGRGDMARLLFVDDSAVNRRLGRLYLESLGYQVDVANNGQEALTAIQAHRYDVVFMDCNMPVMDGYDATRAIRGMAGDRASIPIIAITGHMAPEDWRRAQAVGMNDLLAKPFNKPDLQRAIKKWLILPLRNPISGPAQST